MADSGSAKRVVISPDPAQLAESVATRFLSRVAKRVDEGKLAHISLTGGSMGSAVLAAAADDLGPAAAPMICVEGQPSTPARLLLAQLTRAGSTLVYHGDFDWAGLSIANLIMREHGAAPWRMSCADYLAAAPTATLALAGEPVEASWDCELSSAMRHHNLVVHEEQVLSELLADLHPRDR